MMKWQRDEERKKSSVEGTKGLRGAEGHIEETERRGVGRGP
jgi:hypothetical protein